MALRADAVALTVAGFDPSSGAGVTADLAVFAAHGVFGTSAVTALTVQSTLGVRRVEPVDGVLLAETLACLEEDLPPAGVKIGMLGGADQVSVVAAYLRGCGRPMLVVLDPVLQSSSGAVLLPEGGRARLMEELLPLVSVVTPNVGELALLTGLRCEDDSEIRAAGASLACRYPGLAVICTGGDRAKPDDLLLNAGEWTVLGGEHIASSATHGTGCAFSSAVLCGLLRGQEMGKAAAGAKRYVAGAMLHATVRGGGRGPMNLMWMREKECLD